MTQKEFEERIGREVSLEEYAKADAVYLASDLDKDMFCEQYKKYNCDLLHELAYKATEYRKLYQEASDYESNSIRAIGVSIADLADKIDNDEVRKEARHILGNSEYIKLCIERNYRLTQPDLDYIHNLL